MTSGSASRALWLPLVPFTLLNIAPRARPDAGGPNAFLVRLIWYLSRLLALSATLLFTLSAIGVGLDLLAWQCPSPPDKPAPGGTETCAWQGLPDVELERRLLFGALVPVLVVAALWGSTRWAGRRYEVLSTELDPSEEDLAPSEVRLDSRAMWHNTEPIRRLRALHVQCALALILAAVLVPTDWWLPALSLATVGVYAAVALWCPTFNSHGRIRGWRLASLVVWVGLGACTAATVVGLATRTSDVRDQFAQHEADRRFGTNGLPYFDAFVFVDAAAAVVLLGALGLVTHLAKRRHRLGGEAVGEHQALGPSLRGYTGVALAALGVFLGAVFAAGGYLYAAASFTSGSIKPSFEEVSSVYQILTVPPTIATAAVAYAEALAALLVVIAVLGGATKMSTATDPIYEGQILSDYGQVGDEPRRKQVRRAMVVGSLVDRAPKLVGTLVLAGVVVVCVAVGQTELLARIRAREALDDGGGVGTDSFRSAFGAYATIATLLGLVSLGALAFRVETTRRSVGVLWDVGAFWPRQCHPLAPPCYAERTVPDLVTYVTHQRAQHPDRPIVLAAHSQGTVIGAAVLFQLATRDKAKGREALAGLGFLTFGCVLRRLYGRHFPVYFGPARLAELQELLTAPSESVTDGPSSVDGTARWINLWRYTDYLGGQVTVGPPAAAARRPRSESTASEWPPSEPPTTDPVPWEWHAPDPPRFALDPGTTSYTAAQRHSNYWADESGYFQLAVERLVAASTGSAAPSVGPPQ